MCDNKNNKPCKEWVKLQRYVAKHCNYHLIESSIWSVQIGGKRGIVYGEEGDREYLCYNSHKCEQYLALLKEYIKPYRVVSVLMKKQDDIDPWEYECSVRNEVEFSGVRHCYLEVLIKNKKLNTLKVVNIKNTFNYGIL